MVSLHTNHAARGALDILRSVASEHGRTQRQVASGYRVAEAADNAAYWSIATTMRSDDKAMAAVEDALSLGAAKVDTAYLGMTASLDLVGEIKAKLVMGREPGVDKLKINAEISQLKDQIYSVVESASFAGQNWLHRLDSTDDEDKEIVSSFVRRANGTVSVETIVYDPSNAYGSNHLIDESFHYGVLTNVEFARRMGFATEWTLLNGEHHDVHPVIELKKTTSDAQIDEMISVVDAMMTVMTDAATTLGSIAKRIAMQSDFAADLRDTMERSVGRLVDTDMDEASTRLKALETREQLALQALSIANSQPGDLLQLFR